MWQANEFAFNGSYSINISHDGEYIGTAAVFARADRCKLHALCWKYSFELFVKRPAKDVPHAVMLARWFGVLSQCEVYCEMHEISSRSSITLYSPYSIARKIHSGQGIKTFDNVVEELKQNLHAVINDAGHNKIGYAGGGAAIRGEAGDIIHSHLTPDITILSSAARVVTSLEEVPINFEDAPVTWAGYKNHGKVFESDSAWKVAAKA